jgi:hypothetical protein
MKSNHILCYKVYSLLKVSTRGNQLGILGFDPGLLQKVGPVKLPESPGMEIRGVVSSSSCFTGFLQKTASRSATVAGARVPGCSMGSGLFWYFVKPALNPDIA